MLYIGADHGGYSVKQHLKKVLKRRNFVVKDMGAKTFIPGDDYPDYAEKVAEQVAKSPQSNLGILLCRSGQGVCVVANKFPGIRASLVWNIEEAKVSRTDDHSNVLCLPADYISPRVAEKIALEWLTTEPSLEDRHVRRVEKIKKLERWLRIDR